MLAAGIAGAFMMMGYAGGNPSEPTQQHAQQQQQEEAYNAETLQDADLVMRQNPQQGYVININAHSNKNKKELQQIVNNSFASSYPTDVNIQMNMRDQSGNINDREIEKILERTFN